MDFRNYVGASPFSVPGMTVEYGVLSGPIKYQHFSENIELSSEGMVLKVTPPDRNNLIGGAQVTFNFMTYGTISARIRFPNHPGTCLGFFIYGSDSAEVDFEYIGVDPSKIYNVSHLPG